MGVTNAGEEYFIKVGLTEQITPPGSFGIGLSQSDEATLGDAVTLAGINEVTGSGYARQLVSSNAVDWSLALTNGKWVATAKQVTFTATGTWTQAKSVFLTDGTRVLAVKNLSENRTMLNGETLQCILSVEFQGV